MEEAVGFCNKKMFPYNVKIGLLFPNPVIFIENRINFSPVPGNISQIPPYSKLLTWMLPQGISSCLHPIIFFKHNKLNCCITALPSLWIEIPREIVVSFWVLSGLNYLTFKIRICPFSQYTKTSH